MTKFNGGIFRGGRFYRIGIDSKIENRLDFE